MILDFGQRLIKFVSLQRVHKFFHCGTGGEPVYIQLGMFPGKIHGKGKYPQDPYPGDQKDLS